MPTIFGTVGVWITESTSPDVALLQEIDKQTGRPGGVDQIQDLGTQTAMQAAFGRFMDYDGGMYGMGILSKQSIKALATYKLPSGAEPRSALAVRIGLANLDQDVLFVGLHLYRTAAERLAQAEAVIEQFKDEKIPVILAGDFNSEPDSRAIDVLSQYWAIPSKGEDHLTFPSVQPRKEIDYIMYRRSDRFSVIESRVIDEPLVSDHRPVLLELQLK